MFTTAAGTRSKAALKRMRSAARQGARWKIWAFYAQHEPVTWGALAYLLIAVTGSLYSLAFYRQFKINIFGFFDTSDFLLSGLQNVKIMIIGVVTIVFIILVYLFFAYNSIFYRAYRRNEQKWRSLIRWLLGALSVILFVLSIFVAPFRLGASEGRDELSKTELQKYPRLVRITTQQDADRPKICLPDALFVGATSSFHFFYNNKHDGNEQILVVPTANIASLEFNPLGDNGCNPKLDDPVIAEIKKINKTIAMLNATSERNTAEVVAAINSIQIEPPIEMPDKIKLDLPEVVAAIGKVTAAIDALRSDPNLSPVIAKLNATIGELNAYLKGNETIANLNVAIAELNATIRALNISGVVNSCAFGGELLGTVRPFQEGERDQLENDEHGNLTAIFGEIKLHLENNTLLRLTLIGRAGREPLGTEERRSYGSQRGLAQAQVEWVQGKILKRFQGQIDSSLIILQPLQPGASLLRMSTDQDPYYDYNPYRYDLPRAGSVAVYACWAPKPAQVSSSAESVP